MPGRSGKHWLWKMSLVDRHYLTVLLILNSDRGQFMACDAAVTLIFETKKSEFLLQEILSGLHIVLLLVT